MFVTNGNIVYSASDLAAAARCEYTLLRDLDAKLGWGPAVDVEDELLARTAALGTGAERRRLDQLRDEFGDAVAVIGRPTHTVAGLTAAAEATQAPSPAARRWCTGRPCSTSVSSDSPA